MVAVLAVTAHADVVGGTFGAEGDNLTWSYNTDSKELTISGTGAMLEDNAYWVFGGAPWHAYAADITKVVINPGVTQIGDYSFYRCVNLKTISIPSSVTWIRSNAFNGCNSLETPIAIPEGQWEIGEFMFAECYKIPAVTIPNSVEIIERHAFEKCYSMTTLHIPAKVWDIGEYNAFMYCSGLTSVTVDKENANFDSRNDCNALIVTAGRHANTILAIGRNSSIPDDGIYLLGTGLYAGREDLTTAVMPDNVYFGGEYVYADCPNLTTVVLSKRAASIPLYSFSGSSSLRDLYFYNEEDILLPYAYNHVFDNVPTEELTLHVPAALLDRYKEYMSGTGYTFKDIVPLADLSKPVAIDGIYYQLDTEAMTAQVVAKPEGTYAGVVNIPAKVTLEFKTYTVTSVAAKAFAGSNAITAITVDASNAYLDARDGCNAIVDKATNTLLAGCAASTIPASITAIGDGAFAGQTMLTTLSLHSGITAIGADAFAGCTGLTAIECYAETVPAIGAGAFTGVNATFKVFASVMEAYQTALTAFTGITVINFPEKIKTPTIAFVGGKLKFGCETAGVTYYYQIVPSDAAQGDTDGEVEVSAEYTVKVHASKEGWIDSDEATLCFNVKGIKGDVNEDGTVDVEDVVKVVNIILDEDE